MFSLDRQIPSTATFQRVYVPGLRSTVEQDLVINLWMLRRGILADGSPTAQVVEPEDRQRTVANYVASTGAVDVDRPWMREPEPAEIVEFHHLDPEQQLRQAVWAGLRRTRMADRFSLGSGYIYEADLTASLPWLSNPRDVYRIEAGPNLGMYNGPIDIPFVAFSQEGHVCIRLNAGPAGPYYGEVLLTVGRAHFNWVNGLESDTGPVNDSDMLDVDLDYAASAAHIEAWHMFPARLQAAAAAGMQATQQMAALEFTRQALIHGPRRPDLHQFQRVFPGGWSHVVINA